VKNKKYFTITIELLFLLILIKLYFNNQKLKEENIENINNIDKLSKKNSKLESYYELYNLWIKSKNIVLKNALAKKGYNKIAIYGCGIIGKNLISVLKDENANIKYIIDKEDFKEKEIENKDIKYINASDVDKLQKLDVDIIIVTPVFSYKEISESLKGCVNCDIYSFKDLLEVIQYE
jgi:Prephenate dehydrogenase